MKKLKFNFKLSLPQNFNSKAMLFTLCFTYLYTIAEIVYKIKVKRSSCTAEVILLFLIFSIYGVLKKLFTSEELPCDLNGSPLPFGDSVIEKRKRTAFYKKSAAIYSAIFAVITTIAFSCSSILSNVNVSSQLFFNAEFPNFIFAVIISIIFLPIIFVFAYMIEYFWYEYKVALYKEKKRQFEEQEARHRAILLKLQEEAKQESANTPKRRGRPPKKKIEE